MDSMKIMMKMTDFRRLKLKIKQERTVYSFLLGCNVSRKTSFLISLSDFANLQFTAHPSFFFSPLFFIRGFQSSVAVPFDSSKAILSRVMYLTLRCFMSLYENPSGILVSANRCIFLFNSSNFEEISSNFRTLCFRIELSHARRHENISMRSIENAFLVFLEMLFVIKKRRLELLLILLSI